MNHNDHDPFGVIAAMAELDRLGGPLAPSELQAIYDGSPLDDSTGALSTWQSIEPTLCGVTRRGAICDLLTDHNTGHWNEIWGWWI